MNKNVAGIFKRSGGNDYAGRLYGGMIVQKTNLLSLSLKMLKKE
ncbi:hypothetical protein RB531_4492 [Salmonella enterica subsp. enterica serovar Typhimurium]